MSCNGRKPRGDAHLVTALASGRTVRYAAKEAGLAERTVYRRLKDVGFRRQVTQARAEMFEQAVARLADAAVDAVDVLRRLAKHGQSETVQLGASRSILELGNRLREVTELEGRLFELEQRIDAQNTTPPH